VPRQSASVNTYSLFLSRFYARPGMETFDVIVVGAGISGLTAASEMSRLYGLDRVKVLEARHNVGG
jgi:monoamine oxidase